MKKLAAVLLILILSAGLCSCKARTGYKPPEESKKGARENMEISDNSDSPDDDDSIISESGSGPESDPESEPDTRPGELAAALLEAIKTGERENIQRYADYNALLKLEEGQSADQHFKQLLSHLKWEILSADVKDDRAVIFTKITNVDMAVVLPLYYSAAMQIELDNAMSDEPLEQAELEPEYIKIFSDLLSERKSGVIEKLVDLEFQKSGDDWEININDDLSNAITGGYFTARSLITGG